MSERERAYARWLVDNKDKKGTADFEKVASAYRSMRKPPVAEVEPEPVEVVEEETDYSAVRSGAVDFLESAIGAGDELDASIRLLVGDAQNWKDAIDQSRKDLARFEKENEAVSTALDVAGIATSLFIPGASLVKIAQTGSKAARAAKMAGITGAEGAAYGFLSGEGEERLTGAALGGAIGAGLGGVAGRYLTKGADDVTPAVTEAVEKPAKKKRKKKEPSRFISGNEGFARVGRISNSDIRANISADTAGKKVQEVEKPGTLGPDGKPELKKGSGLVGNALLGNRELAVKNIGERPAKLIEDAETMMRVEADNVDKTFEAFDKFTDLFNKDVNFKDLFVRVNPKLKNKVSFFAIRKAAETDLQREAVDTLQAQVNNIKGFDFAGKYYGKQHWFPTQNINPRPGSKAQATDYLDPVQSLRRYAKDVASSNAVAARFGLNMDDYAKEIERLVKNSVEKGQPFSRLEFVIGKVKKKTAAEANALGYSNHKELGDNMEAIMNSVLVASLKGGDTIGAQARRSISAGLLGNPLNAALNIIEGFTAPVFQNGLMNWAKSVPQGIRSTVSKQLGVKDDYWISNEQLGLGRQYMGEAANTAKQAAMDGVETARYLKLPRMFNEVLDTVGKAAYRYTGVEKVNRMSQEMLSNSAVKNGIGLAKAGKLDQLRKHPGMRGLNDTEFDATVKALKKLDKSGLSSLIRKRDSYESVVDEFNYIANFAGASIGKWQPISASSLPRGFTDNPNARVAYSMLTYMNRQMNNIRTEIGLNMIEAQKKGLNTKEGAQHAKDAMLNAAKYTALFGVVTGIWDDARKTMDFTNDKYLEDVFTPEGVTSATMNQLASNISSGAYNIRAQQYGGDSFGVKPPPLTALQKTVGGVEDLAVGLMEGESLSDASESLRRVGQTYAPGLGSIDRIIRMTPVLQDALGRERLLTED